MREPAFNLLLGPGAREWRCSLLRAMAAAVALAAGCTRGAPPRSSEPPPVLGDTGQRLGTVHFPVSCSATVQPSFDRAVALLHHMTYPQARTGFEEIVARDTTCAMAHWGIAMTLFQPLWPTRPSPVALQRGWNEVQRAIALQPTSERERLFIATTDAFFRDPGATDYWLRIRRWAQATAALHDAFPNDDEASAFDALALLAAIPLDSTTRRNAEPASALLLTVLARNANHPGAMHYLVHANDANGREHNALEITRRYDAIRAGQSACAPHADAHLHAPR